MASLNVSHLRSIIWLHVQLSFFVFNLLLDFRIWGYRKWVIWREFSKELRSWPKPQWLTSELGAKYAGEGNKKKSSNVSRHFDNIAGSYVFKENEICIPLFRKPLCSCEWYAFKFVCAFVPKWQWRPLMKVLMEAMELYNDNKSYFYVNITLIAHNQICSQLSDDQGSWIVTNVAKLELPWLLSSVCLCEMPMQLNIMSGCVVTEDKHHTFCQAQTHRLC